MKLSKGLVALLEQSVISASNFFVGVLLARSLGIDDFGVFGIAFVLVILATSAHGAVFALPMMGFAPKLPLPERRLFLNRIHAVQLQCSFGVGCMFLLTSLPIQFVGVDLTTVLSGCLALMCVPSSEWLRRYLFTVGRVNTALFYSLLKYGLWITSLLALLHFEKLSVGGALLSLAGASFVGYILIAFCVDECRLELSGQQEAFATSWQQGKDLLPVSLLEWFNLQGFLVVAGWALGASSVGAIRAAQNIVGPLNILYQAADNIFPVRGGSVLVEHGAGPALAYFKWCGLLVLFFLTPICGLIAYYSEELMVLVYGEDYAGFYWLVILQLVSLMLGIYHKLIGAVLRTFNRTSDLLNAFILGTGLALVFVPALAFFFQEEGAMVGKIMAELAVVGVLILAVITVRRNLVQRTEVGASFGR